MPVPHQAPRPGLSDAPFAANRQSGRRRRRFLSLRRPCRLASPLDWPGEGWLPHLPSRLSPSALACPLAAGLARGVVLHSLFLDPGLLFALLHTSPMPSLSHLGNCVLRYRAFTQQAPVHYFGMTGAGRTFARLSALSLQ